MTDKAQRRRARRARQRKARKEEARGLDQINRELSTLVVEPTIAPIAEAAEKIPTIQSRSHVALVQGLTEATAN